MKRRRTIALLNEIVNLSVSVLALPISLNLSTNPQDQLGICIFDLT